MRELRERRAKLIADARQVVEGFTSKGEAMSAEALERVDKLRAEAKAIGDTLARSEDLDSEERAIVPESQRVAPQSQGITADQRNEAVVEALRGFASREQLAIASGAEFRDQGITGNVGGYTIAPDTRFYGQIVEAMKAFGGMMAAPVTVLNTDTGADLPIPTNNDTAQAGSIVAEAGSMAGGTDLTLGQLTLHAYVVAAPIVKVSVELIQDSAANFTEFLSRALGTRIARKKNALLTVGTGSSEHQGIAYASASVGRTCATGYTTSCTADDLLRLKHSVDPAYRNAPSARWMFNDTTLLAISLLKDGDGRYLIPGLADETQARLFGKPFVINTDMVDMGASTKSVAFGDFASYYVRQVRGIQIVRLNELYAATRQVGFMGWERSNGALIDAGMHPVRVLAQAAS